MLQPAGRAAPVVGQIPEFAAPRRCIRGTVISSATARTVDATVRLDGFENYSSSRATSGRFAFCGVDSGSYMLEAFAPGYESARVELTSDLRQADEVTIVLRPEAGQVLPQAAGYRASVSVKSLQVPRQARDQLEQFLRHAGKKDWRKSLASLRKAVEIYPDYVDAWTNMGVVYSEVNDTRMAETAFKRALQIEPNDALVRRKLGYLYLSTRRWDEALAELKIARSLDPTDGRTESYLSFVREQIGKR